MAPDFSTIRETSDLARLNRALAALEAAGYLTLTGETCCASCAYGFMLEKYGERARLDEGARYDRAVFYTEQDLEVVTAGGDLRDRIAIRWRGNAGEIITAINAQGLRVEWAGTEGDSILARPDRFSADRWSNLLVRDEAEDEDE